MRGKKKVGTLVDQPSNTVHDNNRRVMCGCTKRKNNNVRYICVHITPLLSTSAI